jgi:hypothetical protein
MMMSHMAVPLFGGAIKSAVRFGVSSPRQENGFVDRVAVFRRWRRTKHLHEIESI